MEVCEKMQLKPLGLNISAKPTQHCYWPSRSSFLQIRIFFSKTVKIMAINRIKRRHALSRVLKNVCSEGFRNIIFSSIYCRGFNWSLLFKGIERAAYWKNTSWRLLKRFFFAGLFLLFLISNLGSCCWPLRTLDCK